jgi:tetratricopeptide (TPR) repeat protein
MKENKWVIALIVVVLIAAAWFVYPSLFPRNMDSQQATEYEQALILVKQGKLDEARTLLKQGIAKEPTEGKYHFALGNIARQQNNMDEALSQYEQAIQKSPKIVEAHNNKTAVLMLQNKMEDALKAVEAGLSQDPAFKDLLFKKGQLLYVKKDYDQAISTLQPLSSDTEYIDAYRFVALSLLQQQKYEAALEQFKLYLEKTPADGAGRVEVQKTVADIEAMLKTK